MKLLEKGLNFCPSSKNVDKEELMDDIFSYCRSIRLKHYFHTIAEAKSRHQPPDVPTDDVQADQQEAPEESEPTERCEMRTFNLFVAEPRKISRYNENGRVALSRNPLQSLDQYVGR